MRANAPDFIQYYHPVQGRPNKPSVSSADNLLEPVVFTKLQRFKWTVKFETGPPFLKTQNCSADSVPGTWPPRTPSTTRSAYQCDTTVLERQSLRDTSTTPRSEKYQVLSSPNWFSTCIEEARLDKETAHVFKLTTLVGLYQSRMQQLGVKLDTRVHSTRLMQRLLAQFPDIHAHTHIGKRRPTGI